MLLTSKCGALKEEPDLEQMKGCCGQYCSFLLSRGDRPGRESRGTVRWQPPPIYDPECACLLLSNFSFSRVILVYCHCTMLVATAASSHISQREPEKYLFCSASILSESRMFGSVWPGSNINAFLCPSMEEKQIS